MFGNAVAYDRFMARWSRLVAPLLIDFADVPNEGPVLDVGSAIGTLAFEMATRNTTRRVTGIDLSKEFIAYATSINPFHERVSFSIGDAQDLHFADDTFVASLSLLVLNFIPHREKALRELCRVTRAAGRIAAGVWDYGGNMRMLRAFWDAAAEVDQAVENLDERHMPLCREGELSELWKQIGLEDVSQQPLDVTMRFDSFEDYWEPFLLGQGPAGAYLRTVQSDRLQVLRSAVKQQLSISSESEGFILPARVWAVRGSVPH